MFKKVFIVCFFCLYWMKNQTLDLVRVNLLVDAIKQKKELQSLPESYVREQLLIYFKQYPKVADSLSSKFNPKSSLYKQTVKEIRSKLRKVYGLFRQEEKTKGKEETITSLIKDINNESILEQVLSFHTSTKERLRYYLQLYEKIFKITKKPKSILDLGCGINPFSIPIMKLHSVHYYAYDLSEEEIKQLNSFFEQLNLKNKNFIGQAGILDILDITKLKRLPHADVAFLFKITDVLDKGKGHIKTEEVIRAIPSKFIVVSFATKTMSGKKMTAPRRKWMEWLCQRLQYKYHILEFENEIYYIIKKRE